MASISTIKTDISSLRDYQLEELFNYIGEMLTVGTSKILLMKFLRSPDLVRVNPVLTVSLPLSLRMES